MILSQNTTYEDMGMDRAGYVHDHCCENDECSCEGVLVYEKIEDAEM